MAVLSPSDIAFEGFRLTRERPKALAIWTGFYFIVSLGVLAVLAVTGLREVMQAAEPTNSDPTAALAALGKGTPGYILLAVLGLGVQAVMMSAVFRAVLRPEDSRFGYLRFGRDELRQVVLFLVLVVILMVALFVILLGGSIVAGIVHGVLGTMGSTGAAIGVLAGVGIGIWVTGLVVFVVVRLSLAPPLTFASRRVRVFAAWRLTHGQFWRLLGTYALAVALYVVVFLVAMIFIAAVVGAVGLIMGYGIAEVSAMFFRPDLNALTIPMLLYTLFSAALTATQYAALFAPSAVAYRILAANHPEITHAQPQFGAVEDPEI